MHIPNRAFNLSLDYSREFYLRCFFWPSFFLTTSLDGLPIEEHYLLRRADVCAGLWSPLWTVMGLQIRVRVSILTVLLDGHFWIVVFFLCGYLHFIHNFSTTITCPERDSNLGRCRITVFDLQILKYWLLYFKHLMTSIWLHQVWTSNLMSYFTQLN